MSSEINTAIVTIDLELSIQVLFLLTSLRERYFRYYGYALV
jgi:hypothetical protein